MYIKVDKYNNAISELIAEENIISFFSRLPNDEELLREGFVRVKDNTPALEEGDSLEILGFKKDTQGGYIYEYSLKSDLTLIKQRKIDAIKETTFADAPITINDVTFNGGIESASAIQAAINLSTILGEESVALWDIHNQVRTFTIQEATNIALEIGKKYREVMYLRQHKIQEVLVSTTLEAINAVTLINPPIAVGAMP